MLLLAISFNRRRSASRRALLLDGFMSSRQVTGPRTWKAICGANSIAETLVIIYALIDGCLQIGTHIWERIVELFCCQIDVIGSGHMTGDCFICACFQSSCHFLVEASQSTVRCRKKIKLFQIQLFQIKNLLNLTTFYGPGSPAVQSPSCDCPRT